MSGYRSRPYAGNADYTHMRRLLVDVYAMTGPPVYCTLGDLDWWRATDDDAHAIARARLWEALDGAVVGFAWPSAGYIDVVSHPLHRPIEAEMLAWAEREAALQQSSGADRQLVAWSDDGDTARVELLRARGYCASDDVLLANMRGLDGDLPQPELPTGYRLTDMARETDLEQRVAVHRDAFAPSRMTVEKHRRVMASPTYRPDLDLVVVAPDGSFAAYCIAWLDDENRLGLFEPVGCHSAHRQLGLASAVLAEGLRRLVALGATTAYVNSHGAEDGPNRLYQRMGFTPTERIRAWHKLL